MKKVVFPPETKCLSMRIQIEFALSIFHRNSPGNGRLFKNTQYKFVETWFSTVKQSTISFFLSFIPRLESNKVTVEMSLKKDIAYLEADRFPY
jgi:hypothetical protein